MELRFRVVVVGLYCVFVFNNIFCFCFVNNDSAEFVESLVI